MRDVKKVYRDTFAEVLEQYNKKQTRADRRIDDYFEYVSKNQDMAVEIIFQCGDKDFWKNIFIEIDNEKENKENICKVYDTLLEQLQKKMPDFKVANALVHLDEASPHMHVVGVPVGRGFKRGLETKVSKRFVFTPKTLENSEAERQLSNTKMEIAGAEKDLLQIKMESRETKQKLMAEQEEIKQENLSLKTDTLTLHSRKENLLYDVSVLDKELEKRLDFINVLDKLKAILHKLLSMILVVREFARLVEEKRDIRAASPYGYTPLGRLLKEYRTPLPRYERLVIFPEIASWQTLKVEVVLLYEDFNRRGTNYRLAGFWNVQTEQAIKISEIRDEIIPENRIRTLEQAAVYMKAVESFMEEMKTLERTRDSYPVYRADKDEWNR